MSDFTIRPAVPGDEGTILAFIRELAVYEKLENMVVATEELLREWIFEKKTARVLIAEENGTPVGYALYFYNFSTFLGRAGIYLEDLYIQPTHRKKGYGKALLAHLAGICEKENLGRLEWSCLDWNQASIDFYLSLGASPMEGWTQYRLTFPRKRPL
ncbi:MAG: GNAT family N-acetyltransferase [Clostridiaceae bacterium]|nr:GNAT family N-acetyltransferase [Clostridiaceae bacterium]